MGAEREYIQIVSAPCAHCERRIVSLDDGAACPDCPSAVHVDDACWQAHWEAKHAGGASYRGAKKAPPPVKELPPDRVGGRPVTYGDFGGAGDLVCTSCHHRVAAPTKLTFLGFRQFTCPDCAMTVLHPLTSGRKTLYFIVVGLSIAVTLFFLSQGQLAFPGLIAVLAIVALSQNRGLEQKLERAEMAAPSGYATSDSGSSGFGFDPGSSGSSGVKKRKKKKKKASTADES